MNLRQLPLMILPITACLPATAQLSCTDLLKQVASTVSINLATTIETGAFTPTGNTGKIDHLPAFCRVTATLKPTSDSDIHTEFWLPTATWNGKFLAVGSGGWGGSIAYRRNGRGAAPRLCHQRHG